MYVCGKLVGNWCRLGVAARLGQQKSPASAGLWLGQLLFSVLGIFHEEFLSFTF